MQARAFRAGTVVEDVPEVRVATLAANLDPVHAEAVVVEQAHVLLLFGTRETRPAAVRLEF